MHYWQHPSMRDQNYNSDEFYPIIVESLAHQYPPRQQQPTYNQQVLSGVPDDHQISDALTTGASGRYSTPTSLLRRCYDVSLHSHVKALENRNKHEHPPDKVNDVQNPLVDSGRVVVAFPDQQSTSLLPFSERAQHCPFTGKANSQSYRRPLQQSENQPFDEEYATSRANQLTERDFSGSFCTASTYTNQNSQKQHINPSQSRTKDTHRKTSTTSPNPPSTNPNLPLPTFFPCPPTPIKLPSTHTLCGSRITRLTSHSDGVDRISRCCPQLAFLFVDSDISDECGTDTNSVEVANTREEGSDGEKAGERAEKVAADFQSLVDYYDDLDIINQL
ncbi:hypothetical protein BLNAU_22873 [Blattamonas nauphoetae]|uniref:Uncharacterized protein n=1 Tax=Blattamonas nauphoetae TaxID=2049346 RepID=A0ABQ9WSB4_9EUKA|nr:hypothetical protein BLNAU_22873 [Blattamonas nauphoetae]